MHKLIKIFLLILIVLTILIAIPQVRYAIKAALFIPQILPAIQVKPLEYFSGTPIRKEITFQSSQGISEADIYLPSGDGIHPGVVFFMGIVPPDREEERILALAEGLARTGMVVLIPWLDTQTENRMIVTDIEVLVDAFQHLQNHERVDSKRVGMGGICTGASMSVVAAQSKRINEEVAFINSFAGYFNAFDLVKSTAVGTRYDGSETSEWLPDHLTKNLVNAHLIEGAGPIDEQILNSIMATGSWNQHEYDSLSLGGKAVLTLLTNPTSQEADEAINNLNNETSRFLSTVSPSTNMEMLKADVLLMHDFHDKLVPAEESRRFAEALIKNEINVYHTEFSLFQNAVQVHKDETDKTGRLNFVKQALKLYKHMYKIMSLSG